MNSSLQRIEMLSPMGSWDAYVQAVNQIPVLSQAEEAALAKRFYYENDLDAARQLVLAHLRFVVKIAHGYAGYGLAQNDLAQEGNIGLMKAVKRFNPEMGVRLVSFAVHWIKAEIHEFILRNWRIVKMATTKAQRKLFFNIRNAKKRLGWFNREEVHAVANDLGVTPEEVYEMEQRMAANDTAFDGAQDEGDEDAHSHMQLVPAHYLADRRYDPAHLIEERNWVDQGQQNLHTALATLDKRSRDILTQRWLNDSKATLHELAATYQVSAERIRQLEQNALKKLKEAMNNEVY